MQQHQVDNLRFGVNANDDLEWKAFARWYALYCQKPPSEHIFGTVFPLSPDELRDRLRNQ